MPAKVHIGTSGWHYKHWLGVFYPEIREHMKRFPGELGYTVALATNEDDSLRLMDVDQPKVQLILLKPSVSNVDGSATVIGKQRAAFEGF